MALRGVLRSNSTTLPNLVRQFSGEIHSIERILESYVPDDERKEVYRMLYGALPEPIEIPTGAADHSEANNYEIKGYKFAPAPPMSVPSRTVRIALVQNSVVLPLDAPVADQYEALEKRMETLIAGAGLMGANILGTQEAWTSPFFVCTREKRPWTDFAESAETGQSVRFMQRVGKQHNMVVLSAILERDENHGDVLANTCVVIGNNGNIIGKHRKNHIPRVGDFNESSYYLEGQTGHPVFETAFGRIGINICYGRHHPLNWMGFGLNGAEIVYNPSATVGKLSEPMWPIEARNAAIANSYYVAAINRVGTETYPNEFTSGDGAPAHRDFGHFYGSSYVASPNAARSPGLSRVGDGVLVCEVDLNMCRHIKDVWMLRSTARYDLYSDLLQKYLDQDFHPQVIRDPSLDARKK